MGNKYDGNGNMKTEEAKKDQVLLGIVMKDGKLIIDYDKEAPLHELIRFYGILTVEVPFLMQHLKAQKAQQEKSGLITPGKG